MAVIHKYNGNLEYQELIWDGVEVENFHLNGNSHFKKQVLIGPKDNSKNFAIRYFELLPGNSSPLHSHAHEHGIFILHGKATLQINETLTNLSKYDVVFIPGEELHQITNTGKETVGFLCTIIRSAEG